MPHCQRWGPGWVETQLSLGQSLVPVSVVSCTSREMPQSASLFETVFSSAASSQWLVPGYCGCQGKQKSRHNSNTAESKLLPLPAESWQWPCFQFKSPPKPSTALGESLTHGPAQWREREKKVGLSCYLVVLDSTSQGKLSRPCLHVPDVTYSIVYKGGHFLLEMYNCDIFSTFIFSWTLISPGWSLYDFSMAVERFGVCCLPPCHCLPPGILSP